MVKICTKCGMEYPATKENFFVNKQGKCGLASRCKKCFMESQDPIRNAERKRKWYEDNIDKAKLTARLHYQQNKDRHNSLSRIYREEHPELMKQYHKEHYERNKEQYLERSRIRYKETKAEFLEQCKKYREKNKEKIRQYFKEYAEVPENQEKLRVKKARHKQRKRNLPADLTPDQWLGILEKFNHQCCYCGQKVESLQQDHFIPVSKGGWYTEINIVPACPTCNASKNNKDYEDWYQYQSFYDVQREELLLNHIRRYYG